MDKEMLQAIKELLQNELKPVNDRLEKIELAVEEIREIVVELEPKNATRHLEISNSIDVLRKDLANVEIITGSNWIEIAKLKKTI